MSTTDEQQQQQQQPVVVKRRVGRPGRKPLDTAAKNRRTAQNRAAQRAFRERKERKMKELEDKISDLERIKDNNEVESTFLRDYMMDLICDMQKYRPNNSTDSKVLKYLSLKKKNQPSMKATSIDSLIEMENKKTDEISKESPDSTLNNNANNNNNNNNNDTNQVPSPNESTGSHISSPDSQSLKHDEGLRLPSFSNKYDINSHDGGGITSSNWIDNIFDGDTAEGLPSFPASISSSSETPPVNANDNDHSHVDFTNNLLDHNMIFTNEFSFHNQFDDHPIIDLTTQQKPTQQQQQQAFVISNTWDSNSNGNSTDNDTQSLIGNNINNNNPLIDSNLAFPTDINENEVFVKQYQEYVSQQQPAEQDTITCPCQHADTGADDDDEEIECEFISRNLLNNESIPSILRDKTSIDGGMACNKYSKCSAIWKRFKTQKPKFSDDDIDSLCQELITKAKCSDEGTIVIRSRDVKNTLRKHF
ncbi:hypothetical protein NCAS_0F01100 [Naumovozyma castellii]|uniref:BZIP domain-containing protein n=1 Tax=Naumovozyma castellii TaxID=27288 RepID=G0VGH3_NAUCA|nr:hypothetical protein NCAS_0F01100 [Naumovozyma castellii CBS 4309]CCC70594.1 hypothetical protein NCAS_0F01100 [Naumovozyma castellii CBS 4309]